MSTKGDFSPQQSIQFRVLGGVASTIILLLIILYFPLRTILLNTFNEIELDTIQKDIERVEQGLQSNIVNLGRITRDYAHWDDTYAYAEDRNTDYTDSNLSTDGMEALEIELILIQNLQGTVLYAQSYDPETGSLSPVNEGFIDRYDEVLENHSGTTQAVTGVVLYEGIPAIVASYPILPTSAEGPSRGSFIMGRKLNEMEVSNLSTAIRQDVELFSLQSDLPNDVEAIRAELSRQAPTTIHTPSTNQIVAYTMLYDILGQPVGIIRITEPRPIYNQAIKAIGYISVAILLTGLLLSVIVVELIRRFILNRVLKLNTEMQDIAQHPAPEARLTVTGHDELSQLTATINSMIGAIADVQSAHIEADKERERLQQQMISIQQQSLAKLSVPLIPISDQIVVMPLIGAIDASRSARIRETLLQGIMERRAHTAILDITGLDIIDEEIAQLLLQLARAAQLVGAQVFLTGMQATVAHILMDLEISMNHLETYSTLQQGIAAALRQENTTK